jgi:hypothetical protein
MFGIFICVFSQILPNKIQIIQSGGIWNLRRKPREIPRDRINIAYQLIFGQANFYFGELGHKKLRRQNGQYFLAPAGSFSIYEKVEENIWKMECKTENKKEEGE